MKRQDYRLDTNCMKCGFSKLGNLKKCRANLAACGQYYTRGFLVGTWCILGIPMNILLEYTILYYWNAQAFKMRALQLVAMMHQDDFFMLVHSDNCRCNLLLSPTH